MAEGRKLCAILKQLKISKEKNETKAVALTKKDTIPLSYERAFGVIKTVLYSLSPPEEGRICYVSERFKQMTSSILKLIHLQEKKDKNKNKNSLWASSSVDEEEECCDGFYLQCIGIK